MSRILIVDDEPLIAMMLADWVSELGHETLGPSYSAESAMALIETSPPDAAIVDVSLGSASGYPVAELLVQKNIPFVFATGHGEEAVTPRFAGTALLAKPFDFAGVSAALDRMLA